MDRPGPLAGGGAVADVGPAGLVVAAPRHARHLQPAVGAGGVDLDVEGSGRGGPQIASAQVEHPVGQPQVGHGRLGPGQDVGMRLGGLLGGAEPVQLHLVELVDPQQAAGVAARGAGLPAEAGGVGHQPHGQVGGVEDLVADQRGERHLGGGDGPQVVALQVVGVVGELGQVAGGHHGLGPHQGGGPDLLVGVAVAVQAVVDQGPHQPGPQAAVHDEHGPGHAHGPVGVEQPQLGADLPVRHPLVIARRVGVAHRFGHHVVVGPGPVGAVLRGQIADHQQPLADLLGQLVGLGRPVLGLTAQLPAAVLEAGRVAAPPG